MGRGQRISFAALSVALHTAVLVAMAGFAVRPPAEVRRIIRLALLSDGTTGAGSAAPAAIAAVSSGLPAAPPVARPAAAVKIEKRRTETAGSRRAVAKNAAAVAPAIGTDGGVSNDVAASALGEAGGKGQGGGGSGSGGGDALRRYLASVRTRIEAAKQYPHMARRNGVEGRVAVSFEVTASGDLQKLTLRSADHPLLADAALRAVQAAAPFPGWPAEITLSSVQLEVPLRFSLHDDEEEESCRSNCEQDVEASRR